MNCQAPLAGDDDGVTARTVCHWCGGTGELPHRPPPPSVVFLRHVSRPDPLFWVVVGLTMVALFALTAWLVARGWS